jgi:hypothetical protein
MAKRLTKVQRALAIVALCKRGLISKRLAMQKLAQIKQKASPKRKARKPRKSSAVHRHDGA